MKKRARTKALSIIALVLIILVTGALIRCEKPVNPYSKNTADILKMLDSTEYLIYVNPIDTARFGLIDLRNSFEFEKGHLPGAVNIYAPEILYEDHQNIMNKYLKEGKTLLLYSKDPHEAVPAFMVMAQVDLVPVKILQTRNYFEKDKLVSAYVEIEQPTPDIAEFIDSSVKKVAESKKSIVKKVAPPPKKVAPKKKKKKKMPEGGC